MMKFLLLAAISFGIVCVVDGYDNVDFEIYDLYEEVNGTFYELLGIGQDVSTSEIRRAYRKLSLVLHPDKSKSPNAEEEFRQLVAVYEILKDPAKREKYDYVLVNGLPDWRNPIYYYRKYRKMGTTEVAIIVALIATIGHYLTWWVAYWEKRFEMDEVLAPVRKRREKRKAKRKLTEQEMEEQTTDEILERELGYRRPTMWDFLPFVLYRLVVRFVKSIPKQIKEAKRRRDEEKERKRKQEEEEREAAEAAKITRPKRVKPKIALRDASDFENEDYFVSGIQGDAENPEPREKILERKNTEWLDEDYAALAKTMAKFPGGTPGRWDKIAHELGRSAGEVTKKVKEMKETLVNNVNKSSDTLATRKKQAINLSDAVVTKAFDTELNKTAFITDNDLYQSQYDIPDDYDQGTSFDVEEPEIDYAVVKKKVKTRPVEEKPLENEDAATDSAAVDSWSQVQQKCLEAAIAQFPKSTTDRWICIALAVPDKNKEQCIARFKLLAEHVKQRKLKQSKGS